MEIICVILVLIILGLIYEVYNIKKSLKEILEGFKMKVKSDSNSLIMVSSNDKDVKLLADEINKNFIEFNEQKNKYVYGNDELKKNITNITHDIRTPITAIIGYLDLLEKNEEVEQNKEYINIIRNRVEYITELSTQVFDYSKFVSQENIVKDNISLNQVLEESIGFNYCNFKNAGLEPVIKITNKDIRRNLNKEMISRALENLISNAIKYAEGNFSIELKDNGEIILANKCTKLDEISVKNIFDRYYTVENARQSNGIGLSIARQLIELNGGMLEANLKNDVLEFRIFKLG